MTSKKNLALSINWGFYFIFSASIIIFGIVIVWTTYSGHSLDSVELLEPKKNSYWPEFIITNRQFQILQNQIVSKEIWSSTLHEGQSLSLFVPSLFLLKPISSADGKLSEEIVSPTETQ